MNAWKLGIVALLITAAAACKDKAPTKEPPSAAPAPAEVKAPEATAPAANAAPAEPTKAGEPKPIEADVETPSERGRSYEGPPADPASTEECCCKAARPQGDFEIAWIPEKDCAAKKGSCIPNSLCD